MKYDVLLRSNPGGETYEVITLNSETIKEGQLEVGEMLYDSEIDDLLQMGYKVEFEELQ